MNFNRRFVYQEYQKIDGKYVVEDVEEDIQGFEKSIQKTKFNVEGKKVLVLGAGGVVPSIIFALKKMRVNEILISNRTKNKATDLKNYFKDLTIIDWGDVPNFDMVINATSVGLNKEDKIDIDFSAIGKNKFFFDIIYNPRETKFLKLAKTSGNLFENGKMMFIYQAAAAFEIWHGLYPEINNKVIEVLDND